MIAQAFLIILTVCGGALGKNAALESNRYLGSVLNLLPHEADRSNVDPAQIKNFTIATKDKVLFVTSKLNVTCYDGKMTGLLKIQRLGDCSPPKWDNGNSTIKCTLSFNDIKFNYNANLKYGKLPSIKVTISAKMNPTTALIEVMSNPNRNIPSMKKLALTKTGVITSTFSGLGPAKKHVGNKVYTAFSGSVKNEFFNVFSLNLGPSLGRAVSSVSLPLPSSSGSTPKPSSGSTTKPSSGSSPKPSSGSAPKSSSGSTHISLSGTHLVFLLLLLKFIDNTFRH